MLNSKLFTLIFSKISSTIRGGFLRWKRIYVEKFQIRTIDFDNPQDKGRHDRLVGLVEKMLEAKRQLAEAQTDKDKEFFVRFCSSLDGQIDNLVYELYDLTDEEIAIVEG